MDSSKPIKTLVLQSEMAYLCEELGDPGRYIPSLRSKNLLDSKDTQLIRNKSTSADKVELLLDIVLKREGNTSEHPLDILINELKKQRVQVHIARRLQRTLKKKLKDSETEMNDTRTNRGSGEYRQHSQVPRRSQTASSVESVDYNPFSHERSAVTPQAPGYEINPSVGPIPNPPPPLTSLQNSTHTASDDVDPEHGLRPGTPPPTSQRLLQDGTLGPSTPPRSSQPSLVAGMEGLTLNSHFMNGDSDAGGQSYLSYTSIESESSLFTASSYPTIETADLENEKLRAQIEDLRQQLQMEQANNKKLSQQLFSTRQELTFARQELATSKQKISQASDVSRHETVVRPGTLFPTQYPEHLRYRQLSPARVEAKNSQGDNISIRSANSSTSVNSNSSLGNMPRTQVQSFV